MCDRAIARISNGAARIHRKRHVRMDARELTPGNRQLARADIFVLCIQFAGFDQRRESKRFDRRSGPHKPALRNWVPLNVQDTPVRDPHQERDAIDRRSEAKCPENEIAAPRLCHSSDSRMLLVAITLRSSLAERARRAPYALCALTVAAQFCCLLSAQTQATGARFTVSGVVVNSVTGEPLPRALVMTRGGEQHTAFTGADGRFQMEGLPQGVWFFFAQKPGFLDSSLSALNRAAAVKVASDTSLVTVKLAPESQIDGRVVDRDGEGIEGLNIQCMLQTILNGRKTWQMSGGTQTDETGNFHLQGLRPGGYVLRTGSQPLFPNFEYQNPDSTLPRQVYPPHFYPEAADLMSLQPLTVRPGETARADFSIAPVTAFRVSGTVNPAHGGIQGWVRTSDGNQLPNPFFVNPRNGTWNAPALPPGAWNIVLASQGGQNSGFAEQLVNITSSDVKNVQMMLQPLASIAVNVASPTTAGQRQVQVELQSESQIGPGARMYGSSRNPQNMNETPLVRDVPPGTYWVSVRPYANECLAAVSSGGTDLARNPLVISTGAQPGSIDVTLEDNCATIQGQVHMETPVPDASVILVASSRVIWPQTVALQSDGSFTINRLSPGDYRLYAVSTAAGLEYANPDAMRQIEGASITLSAKQKANVTLNLVMRDGTE